MKKILALALALTLCLGLVPTAGLAYTTADFSDVPSTHWAYGAVMRMADKGVLNGVGEGKFNPDGKVTAEQFITLVGRAVFPDIKVEGKDWSGPYISEAKAKGMLEGTNVTDEAIKSEITRYDMAVILAKAVEILKVTVTKADASKVNDYGDIPNRYTDAVLMAYGSGLITGDDNHNFNGGNTMRRSEAATVMDRLLNLQKPTGGNTTTEPTKSDYEKQTTEEYLESNQDNLVTYTVNGYFRKTDHDIGRPAYDKHFYDFPDMPYKVYYTKDGGKTSVLVAEGITGNKQAGENPPHGEGTGEIKVEVQLPEDAFVKDWKQQGIYFSAETEVDGQKLVTSDLRTDGRAYVTVKNPNVYLSVELTPPTGEKAKLNFHGTVGHRDAPVGLEGFTVQLYHKNGMLLGETVSGPNGKFSMDFEVDEIDGGFDIYTEQYYCIGFGYEDGVFYEDTGKLKNGEYFLVSADTLGANPRNPGGFPVIV